MVRRVLGAENSDKSSGFGAAASTDATADSDVGEDEGRDEGVMLGGVDGTMTEMPVLVAAPEGAVAAELAGAVDEDPPQAAALSAIARAPIITMK